MSDNIITNVANEEESIANILPNELVEALTPAKFRCITLYLSGMYTNKKIAQIIGVSENTIRAWLMQDTVQQVIKIFQQREFDMIDSKLKSMRNKALDTMSDLMDSVKDEVRLGASKDILDRTGHKAMQQIKVDKTVTTIEQQLKNLSNFNIDESNIIDVDEFLEELKDD